MSATLLKRSFELNDCSSSKSDKLTELNECRRASEKSKNPFIPEQNQPKPTVSSIIKSKRKRKQVATTKLTKPTRLPTKTNIQMAQDQLKLKSSKAEENLRKLLTFSKPVNLDNETTQKMIRRAQTQKYVIPEPKSKEEQATAFTDEDFRKFEREYFCS